MLEIRAALARSEEELLRSHRLLDAIADIQSLFIRDAQPRELFDQVLATLLGITGSGYGFVGEVLHDAAGAPYLRTFSLTNIAWDEASRALFEKYQQTGLEFRNLDTLFGVSLRTGETVISNDPDRDPRRGGRPGGHPPLDAYLGLPVHAGPKMVGLIGLANRPGGYDQDLADYLAPLVTTCGSIIEAFRNEQERRQAVAALRDSEARYKAVLDTAADAIITIDPQGRIENFNPAAERIFGYTRAEVVGANVSLLMDAPHREAHDSYIAGYLKTGVAKIIGIGREVEGRRKNGERFPMELAIAAMNFGGQRHFSGIVRDISERKATERRLKEVLALQDTILRCAGHAIISTDLDGTIRVFNPAAERLLGYRADEMVGRLTPQVFHDAQEVAVRARDLSAELGRTIAPGFEAFVAKTHDGDIDEREWTYVRKDGTTVPVRLSISALKNAAGQITGFLGIASDLSEQKQANAERQRLLGEFQAIFDLSPDGFVAFDEAGRLKYANPALRRMSGCEKDALLGGLSETEFDRRLANLCDKPQTYVCIADQREDEPAILSRSQPRLMIVKRSVHRLRDETGQALGRVVYFQDITRERELDRMKAEFLSVAAHELRTPVASLHGFSELLLQRTLDEETRRDVVQTIHRQASNLVQLVNELLDLARIDARGDSDFRLRVQPLRPIIDATVRSLMMPGDPRKVELRLASSLPLVKVDKDKLEQALLNVLTNAYKYSPRGGRIELHTLTRLRDGHAEVGIAVRDCGIGMTAEQMEHIFERFYRADTSGAIPGTGLGLSLVKEIMERHQGTVEANSQPGRGSEITLWLPAAAG